ncbi:transposon ty3-I gag-pol polyprotein, partial [Tanacetum coccineum]
LGFIARFRSAPVGIRARLVSRMGTDLEDPKTHTVGGVWSGGYMDHGSTKSMKELDRCYTMLQELRFGIIGGALIHKNREEGRRIAMVPPKVAPQLPKPEVKVEEKIMKAEVLDEHIEEIQDLQSFRVDVKRKSIKDKVRRKKVFDVDEALDIENSWASSFQVRNIKVADAFQEEDELEYVKPLDGEAKQVTYAVQRTLCLPKVSDSSQRNKIFQTKCLVKEKICFIIIDGGSYENLMSEALVKAFKLPTEPHQIGWIKEVPALKVTEICKVPLAIGKHYNELVTCDVVDIEACHVLLGRPWQHDIDATHQLASPKEFQAERKETGVSYALVVKGVEDVMENAIPTVIKPLLTEFGKIVTNDTLDALPPLRNIQHQIDLSRKTTLLVSISNEVLGFDSIKELYANDEDFGNIWMELETKQHQGEFFLLDGYLFKGKSFVYS